MTTDHPAMDALARARRAYEEGLLREALALSEAAHQILQRIPGTPHQAGLVASFYGLLLGTVGRRPHQGLALAREAARGAFWEPRVYEHLARLHLATGERGDALAVIERGLHIAPDDRDLVALRRSLGVRQNLPIPFLPRNHFLNRWLGRARAKRVVPSPA